MKFRTLSPIFSRTGVGLGTEGGEGAGSVATRVRFRVPALSSASRDFLRAERFLSDFVDSLAFFSRFFSARATRLGLGDSFGFGAGVFSVRAPSFSVGAGEGETWAIAFAGVAVATGGEVAAGVASLAGVSFFATIGSGVGEGADATLPLLPSQPRSLRGAAKLRFNSAEKRLRAFATQFFPCRALPCWKAQAACA